MARLRFRWGRTLAIALTGLVAINLIATLILAGVARTSGLRARYFANTDWQGAARLEAIDRQLDTDVLDRRMPDFGVPFSVEWTGYLTVPVSGSYDIATISDDGSFLYIDDELIVDNGGTHRARGVTAHTWLTRGSHKITVRYFDAGTARSLHIQWSGAGPDPALEIIPANLFSTTPGGAMTWIIRVHMPTLVTRLLVSWYVAILGMVGLGVRRVVRLLWPRTAAATAAAEAASMRGLCAVMIAAACLFVAGIWWGVPDYRGWAPDELTPSEVMAAGEQWFSHGWYSIYPPLHYVLLHVWTLPFAGFEALGLLDRTRISVDSLMFIAYRLLSVLMALGIVGLTYAIARDIKGHRAAIYAALVFVVALPLTYYAKTANVDVPYVFWCTLSLMFYVRLIRESKATDFCLFALTGMLAVCTKDQAYGFYVFPAAYMASMSIWSGARRKAPPPGVPSMLILAAMAIITVVTFVICQNLLFNQAGFRLHLTLLLGPGSQHYRMYPQTLAGQAQMLGASLVEVTRVMTWPLAAAAVCGTIAALRRGPRELRFLLLSAVSYYICAIGLVMYVYDRFLLGIVVVLAIVAGAWLAEWTAASTRSARAWRAIVTLAILYACSRAVSLDALMIRDARYCAEDWIQAHVPPGRLIAAVGLPEYLPRTVAVDWTAISEEVTALDTRKPDYLIVNVLYAKRDTTPTAREFYRRLADGSAGYRRVAHCRTSVPFSPLNYEARFQGTAEDVFSNLSKINPPIDLYAKVR
jgi:hypothetical protein